MIRLVTLVAAAVAFPTSEDRPCDAQLESCLMVSNGFLQKKIWKIVQSRRIDRYANSFKKQLKKLQV